MSLSKWETVPRALWALVGIEWQTSTHAEVLSSQPDRHDAQLKRPCFYFRGKKRTLWKHPLSSDACSFITRQA